MEEQGKYNRSFLGSVMLAVAVALLFVAAATPSFISAAAMKDRKLPVYSVERDDTCVSLTFDAAWGNEDTQTLIDILARYEVKATFFVVGFWADKYPESVQALHEAGVLDDFRGVLTVDEAGCAASDARMFEKAARRLRSDARDTVVFAGRLRALQNAKAAGFRVAAVRGAADESEWARMRAEADVVVETYADYLA